MTDDARVAVLRDYPLRLWLEQSEYFDGLLREYRLLLEGEASATTAAAPRRLLELAGELEGRFAGLLQAVNADRQAALDAGHDRMDFRLPVTPEVLPLLEHVRAVLAESDEYCRQGKLLSLPRPPRMVAFAAWTNAEIRAQFDGAEATPWPGPF